MTEQEVAKLREEIQYLKSALREAVTSNGSIQFKVVVKVDKEKFETRCGKCGRLLKYRRICLRCYPLHACPVCNKRIGPRASFCDIHSPHNEAVLIYRLEKLKKHGKEGTIEWTVAQYELDYFRSSLPRTPNGANSHFRQESAQRLRSQNEQSESQKTSGEQFPTSESTTSTG